MKKNLFKLAGSVSVLFLVLLFFGTVRAAVLEPQWTEFCPPKYCDSNKNAFSKDATYWYKRRLQFENSLVKCSAYKGSDLDMCYKEIREAEARKNQVWDVRQEEKYRTTEYNREYNLEKVKYDGINRILETIKK